MAILVAIIIVVLIIVFSFRAELRKKSIEEETFLRMSGAVGIHLWDYASPVQRQELLAGVGILAEDGTYYTGDLLSTKFRELPNSVTTLLARHSKEIRQELSGLPALPLAQKPLSPPADEAATAQKHAHNKELASQQLLAKSKDYTEEERDALLESYRAAINPPPEMIELANLLNKSFDGDFQLASRDGIFRGGAEQRNAGLRSPDNTETYRLNTPEAFDVFADGLAKEISQTFSASRFTHLFKKETLSKGWTAEDALVMW